MQPGDQPGGGDDPADGLQDGGFVLAGSGSGGGRGRLPADGLDDTALSVLQKLPGGLVAFAGPAVALGVPGLLVLIAVGAQAFGALAWLGVARRKLGAFGIRKPVA